MSRPVEKLNKGDFAAEAGRSNGDLLDEDDEFPSPPDGAGPGSSFEQQLNQLEVRWSQLACHGDISTYGRTTKLLCLSLSM